MAQSVNVAKFATPGGDNIISDGYIKTVEKVWLDSYTIAFTNTNTTIDIAVIPANKKITGIDLIIDTTTSQTAGTISIGFSTDASVNTIMAAVTLTHNLTRTTISLPAGIQYMSAAAAAYGIVTAGFQKVTGGTQCTVSIKLNNWTMTTGTIKTIVRYT